MSSRKTIHRKIDLDSIISSQSSSVTTRSGSKSPYQYTSKRQPIRREVKLTEILNKSQSKQLKNRLKHLNHDLIEPISDETIPSTKEYHTSRAKLHKWVAPLQQFLEQTCKSHIKLVPRVSKEIPSALLVCEDNHFQIYEIEKYT